MTGLDEGAVERIAHVVAVGDMLLASGAAVAIPAIGTILGPLKVGQHILITPSACAVALPIVEVTSVAAHEDHAVDRRGAADNLAPRLMDRPAAETRLGLGIEAPVKALHVHRDRKR